MDAINLMDATFTLRDVFYLVGGVAYGTYRYLTVKKNQDTHTYKIGNLEAELNETISSCSKQKEDYDRKNQTIRTEMNDIKSELHKRMNTTQEKLREEIHQLSNGIATLNGLLDGMSKKDH